MFQVNCLKTIYLYAYKYFFPSLKFQDDMILWPWSYFLKEDYHSKCSRNRDDFQQPSKKIFWLNTKRKKMYCDLLRSIKGSPQQ